MTIPINPERTRLPRPGETVTSKDPRVDPLLMFVVPVYRRRELTALCLEQLRWTCDELELRGLRAGAVVIGDEAPTLALAKELGFWTVTQGNEPLARKFNDGFEAAHLAGADYVVPCGSDNWVHPAWFKRLPLEGEVVCHRGCLVVRPDGLEGATLEVDYDGGDGIRIFRMEMFRPLKFRPATDHRSRAIDTSIIERLRRFAGWKPNWVYHEWDATQVIGFQSADEQLNDYDALLESFLEERLADPWEVLAVSYPVEAVERMQSYFAGRG